jgi:hypothetical protein
VVRQLRKVWGVTTGLCYPWLGHEHAGGEVVGHDFDCRAPAFPVEAPDRSSGRGTVDRVLEFVEDGEALARGRVVIGNCVPVQLISFNTVSRPKGGVGECAGMSPELLERGRTPA